MAKKEAVVVDPPKALINLAAAYDLAEKEVEKADLELKSRKKQLAAIEKKFADQMITEGMKSIRTQGFGGFRTEIGVYTNVKDKEQLETFVKKKKLKWLYSVNIHGGKLKSYIKELLADKKAIPPGIELFTPVEIRRFK